MKKLIFNVFRLLWPEYFKGENPLGCWHVAKAYFLQKVVRINSHVPWPVSISTTVLSPEKIVRGTRTPGLSKGCHLDGRNGITFGENVWIGPYVTIISKNHDVCQYDVWVESLPVKIGRDCWLGAHSIVLPTVELGPHTVVGAGAVVTRSFKQGNLLIAGNPARIVKHLSAYKVIES